MKPLAGKLVAVVNAGGPVGEAVCCRLAWQGASLLIVDPHAASCKATAQLINLLVAGLDPNFVDMGEDPWGCKKSAVPFQSTVTSLPDLLAIAQTASSAFHAPVDAIFDPTGCLDAHLVDKLAHPKCQPAPTPQPVDPTHPHPTNVRPGPIVTISSARRHGISVGRVSADWDNVGDAACAHVFGGGEVWDCLAQWAELRMQIPRRTVREGRLELMCMDVFTPLACLVSGHLCSSLALDAVDAGLSADCDLGMVAFGCPQSMDAVRLWQEGRALPVAEVEIEAVSGANGHEVDSAAGNPVAEQFDSGVCRSCAEAADVQEQPLGSYGAGKENVPTGEIVTEGFGLGLRCRARTPEAGRPSPLGPRRGRLDEPNGDGSLDSEDDGINGWLAYCRYECPEPEDAALPISLADECAASVGVSTVKFTVRCLLFGYIAVTFAVPNLLDFVHRGGLS